MLYPKRKASTLWIRTIKAAKLATRPEWQNIFQAKFASAQELLAVIPPLEEYNKRDIVNYYLALHPPQNIKIRRQWQTVAAATELAESSPEWCKFFTTCYQSPKELLIDILAQKEYFISELQQYYLVFHPKFPNEDLSRLRLAWLFYEQNQEVVQRVRSKTLSLSEVKGQYTIRQSEWTIREYSALINKYQLSMPMPTKRAQPVAVVSADKKSFIKPNSTDLASLLRYYLLIHPEYEQIQLWQNAICAANLAHSSVEWQQFFQTEFISPQECLKKIPSSSPHSKATILHYYFIFHPVAKTSAERKWLIVANAIQLSESNKQWADFFAVDYVSPFDLMRAIPESATQTLSTLVNYYTALYPDKYKVAQDWTRAVSSWYFYQKNPEVIIALCSGKVSYRKAIVTYNLSCSYGALVQHVYRLRKYGFLLE